MIHAQELEIENSKLREKLAERDEQLETMTMEHESIVKEKNAKIDDLQVRHVEQIYPIPWGPRGLKGPFKNMNKILKFQGFFTFLNHSENAFCMILSQTS